MPLEVAYDDVRSETMQQKITSHYQVMASLWRQPPTISPNLTHCLAPVTTERSSQINCHIPSGHILVLDLKVSFVSAPHVHDLVVFSLWNLKQSKQASYTDEAKLRKHRHK